MDPASGPKDPKARREDLKKLRQKSEVVKVVDKNIKRLVSDMFDIMHADNGIGLSAPQIGVSKRVIIGEYESTKTPVPRMVLINPEITWTSKKETVDEEGCLSFPNLYGMVKRPERIRYTAMNENGKKIEGKATGLQARVIQHEIDHLDGILFIDRLEGNLYTYEKQAENGE
ncbi:peptide deformylase [candidate division Kazan bacterium]|uniref:Peptide deformylase n=1 Tax=candidate division Kazan bacterium TaxID=2202143 RepID=A0A420ZD90_UNCK3|nr:MAG: peptide deformylase [candidate division Kazan bacterium]